MSMSLGKQKSQTWQKDLEGNAVNVSSHWTLSSLTLHQEELAASVGITAADVARDGFCRDGAQGRTWSSHG